jgi:hypothetical protein
MCKILAFQPRLTPDMDFDPDMMADTDIDRDRVRRMISDMQSGIGVLRQLLHERRMELDRERDAIQSFIETQLKQQ